MRTSAPSARLLAALALVALAGLALRLWLAQGDLWLDEIWSWKLGQDVHSPFDVWRVAHDNNHPLNTLWVRVVGESASALPYRALSLASGTVAIVCAGLLGARRDAFTGIACAVLAASSTLLAYYSAEARGYAPAVACFFGGWLALDRAQQGGRWLSVALWWLCALLGLCAHFTFVFGWGALAVGSLVAALRDQPGSAFERVVRLHALPALCALAIYLGFVRPMAYGGGDAWSWEGVWMQALAWTFGTPESVSWAITGSLLLGVALAWEKRERIVLLVLLFAPPLATALVLKPQFVALRYFSVPLAGAIVLLGSVFGRLPRLVGVLLLGLVAGHNVLRDVMFARAGRGQFRAALEYMAAETAGPSLSLSSDLPFDTRMIVEYHARGLAKPIAWFPTPPAAGVDWLIVNASERPTALVVAGQRYALARVFDAAGPSAYPWALYRRAQ